MTTGFVLGGLVSGGAFWFLTVCFGPDRSDKAFSLAVRGWSGKLLKRWRMNWLLEFDLDRFAQYKSYHEQYRYFTRDYPELLAQAASLGIAGSSLDRSWSLRKLADEYWDLHYRLEPLQKRGEAERDYQNALAEALGLGIVGKPLDRSWSTDQLDHARENLGLRIRCRKNRVEFETLYSIVLARAETLGIEGYPLDRSWSTTKLIDEFKTLEERRRCAEAASPEPDFGGYTWNPRGPRLWRADEMADGLIRDEQEVSELDVREGPH